MLSVEPFAVLPFSAPCANPCLPLHRSCGGARLARPPHRPVWFLDLEAATSLRPIAATAARNGTLATGLLSEVIKQVILIMRLGRVILVRIGEMVFMSKTVEDQVHLDPNGDRMLRAVDNSGKQSNGLYTVSDFMTKKENLVVVKASTSVDEALEMLVKYRITGFPVIDDVWNLVGVVSDYDLLALDTILGSGLTDTSMFPNVDSSWKTFNEIQKLLSKTNGRVIGEVMTSAPLVVRETTNLEDAARLLLVTKHRRFPVVDADHKLVGLITRGTVVRAALQIKNVNKRSPQA